MTNELSVVLAIEDELSEAVLRRLLAISARGFQIDRVFMARGFGQIKAKMKLFATASRSLPHIVLTDLDRHACVPALKADWRIRALPTQLSFHVAVREVESWLLADADGIADYLRVPVSKVPTSPEELADPKQTLVNLARRSKSVRLRDELAPAKGSKASEGPLYNARLGEFVRTTWDVNCAAACSPSLNRTLSRLAAFLAA
jgi:hypothetical protein